MTFVHLVMMLSEFTLAALFLHRAIPSVIEAGKLIAIKMLLLGIVLSFAGIGQLTVILEQEAYRLTLLPGHFALIGYAAISFYQLHRDGLKSWCHEGRESCDISARSAETRL